MNKSMMGEYWTLAGDEQVYNLQRRAVAVLRTIELLDSLHNDSTWTDSCTVAECIEDIAKALGWRHAALVCYMLGIPHDYTDAEEEVAAQALSDGGAARIVVDLPGGGEFIGSMLLDKLCALTTKAALRRALPVAA